MLESVVLKHSDSSPRPAGPIGSADVDAVTGRFVTYVLFIIAVALVFDFINGMHDSANSIATVVSTRVLSPFAAVFWAAFFNFVAAFTFGTAVAKTIGKGLIDVDRRQLGRRPRRPDRGDRLEPHHLVLRHPVLLVARPDRRVLRGRRGDGSAPRRIVPGAAWVKTLSFIVLSPLIGMTVGFALMVAISWVFRKTSRTARSTGGSGGRSSARRPPSRCRHGTNDAQKTMGIIAGLLVANQIVFADPTSAALDVSARPEDVPTLDHPFRARRDRPRHADGRMADRPDDGKPDHQAEALLRASVPRPAAAVTVIARLGLGHPGLDDAHDHRRDRGRGRDAAILGRAVGSGRPRSSMPGS